MAVGDELSVYVELLKQGRTSLRLKAEAIARQRDGDSETVVAEGEFTFVALDDRGLEAELRRADRGDISAGTGAEDDEVVLVRHGMLR
jgi:acyl-CoA hydrolase